jgi:hypothetical protein
VHEYGFSSELPVQLHHLREETGKLAEIHTALWMIRNKTSELDNVLSVFRMVIDRIDGWIN